MRQFGVVFAARLINPYKIYTIVVMILLIFLVLRLLYHVTNVVIPCYNGVLRNSCHSAVRSTLSNLLPPFKIKFCAKCRVTFVQNAELEYLEFYF